MMFEIRSPTNGTRKRRFSCTASVSPTSFERAYEDSGRGVIDSSIGAKSGGRSNGRPRTVSLDAQTTRPTPARTAAWKTFQVESVLIRNVSPSGRSPGAGIAAKWTMASAPATTSWTCPRSVRSVRSKRSFGVPSGTRSTLTTSWPCSRRSRTTHRPPLPLPPVTTIRIGGTALALRGAERQPADELLLEQEVDEDRRDRREERGGGKQVGVREELALEVVEGGRDRPLVARLHQQQ